MLWRAMPAAAADEAAKLYEAGRKAEHAGKMVQAFVLYSQAAQLEPANQVYWMKSQAVQSRAALQSPPDVSDNPPNEPATASVSDPAPVFDDIGKADRAVEKTPQQPPELRGTAGLKDVDVRADAKSIWQQVARSFGLDTVFDGDYEAGPVVHFQLAQADYRQALHAAETITGSFIVPISSRLFLVVKDTDQKRKDLEPTVAVAIRVPQATSTQELTEISQAVRQLFQIEHVALDSQQSMVVLRDRISRVMPARQIFEELLHHRPQVEIEMDLLELDRSESLAYGLDLPTTFQLAYLGTFWNSPVSIPSTITSLMSFGGGQSLFGIGVASATVIANLTQSNAKTLVSTNIRALDGLAASMHIGDRLPVLTSGYFGPSSFSTGGQVYMPPPSFTFEDLGVNLKVTPRIHGMDEVTLDLETEFKVVSGQSLNGIPVISSRKITTKLRLREGEWGVVAGLLTSSEARTIHGIAGLSSIPVLGQLLRKTNKDESTSDVLLILKPTLLNLPLDQYVTPTISTGSDTRPLTPL